MKKIIRLTESELVRLVKRIMTEQETNATTRKCPDPKNQNSYPGVRKVKAQQGLFNKLYNAGLVVDGKYGPKTSEFMKKYIESKGMTPVIGSKEYTGSNKNLVDDTFNGDMISYKKLMDLMIQDGLKNFVPDVPLGCQKFKFDK